MQTPKKEAFFAILFKLKFWELVSKFRPSVLTVLNYHRIYNAGGEKSFFTPNISASRESFGKQLDFLVEKFNIINLHQLTEWISGRENLPPKAALITFDDGYFDNYTNAFPELKKRNIPAVIFLATGFVGANKPFFWDLLAEGIQNTRKDYLSLPQLGNWNWNHPEEKTNIVEEVVEKVKRFSEIEKDIIVENILSELDVSVSEDRFVDLLLNWEHVRQLASQGIDFGAHTVTHPILTRMPLEAAVREMKLSQMKIENEINRKVDSLAYPNGQASDFNIDILKEARCLGFKVAFTLLPGPEDYRKVLKSPLSVRRIFLGYQDSISIFAAKIYGIPRVMEFLDRP